MSVNLKKILIIGGGTAGWMSALWLQHTLGSHTKISLIESKSIGTIGVGEGTTPSIRDFLKKLNIKEKEWMPACQASYKCGISFPDWSTKQGYENYFHPFYSQFDTELAYKFFDNCNHKRNGHDVPSHPDDYFVTTELVRQNKAPVAIEKLPYEHDYGYHFDAGLLGKYLGKKAQMRGVDRIEGTIQDVCKKENGNIDYVLLDDKQTLYADFFVDCSGLKGLLMQKHLGQKLICSRDNIFNDSAVAIQTPHKQNKTLSSQTISKALKHGWVWHIPLYSRIGNGYVYSSNYTSKEDAELELRELLGKDAKDSKAIHLNWNPGRINKHWTKNCLAVGLSQGFLEPLEAAMLNVIQFTLENFTLAIKNNDEGKNKNTQFNQKVNHHIDSIKDYLQLHYLLNSRTDTDYWIDNRNNKNISNTLNEILQTWHSADDFDAVMQKHSDLVYKRTSWYCMLAGMGHFPQATKTAKGSKQKYQEFLHKKCKLKAENFHSHKDYLSSQYNQAQGLSNE